VKRTRLKPGAKSLERGSTFKAKPKGPKRRPRNATAARERDSKPEWWTAEIRGMPCAGGCDRPAVHGHHIITVQMLTRSDAPLWSRPNRMPVCAECHANHHNAYRRLRLPSDHPVWTYAMLLGLGWWIEREYADSITP
jgi:hypothetical protein